MKKTLKRFIPMMAIMVIAVIPMASCQGEKEKEIRREMVGYGEANPPFVEEDGYKWEMVPTQTAEDSIQIIMRSVRRLILDEPLYY